MIRQTSTMLLLALFAGAPVVVGCSDKTVSESSRTKTSSDGTTVTEKQKTTVDSEGNRKTETERKVDR